MNAEEKKKALDEVNKKYLISLQTLKAYNKAKGINNEELEKFEKQLKQMMPK